MNAARKAPLTLSQLTQIWAGLPEPERRALFGLALVGKATSRTDLLRQVTDLGVRDARGNRWVGAPFGHALERWMEKGLVLRGVEAEVLLPHPLLVDHCVREPLVDLVEEARTSFQRNRRSESALVLLLRATLFRETKPHSWSLDSILPYRSYGGAEHLWLQAACQSPSVELWSRLPADGRLALFYSRLEPAFSDLTRIDHFELICFESIVSSAVPEAAWPVAALLLYAGERARARELLERVRVEVPAKLRKEDVERLGSLRAMEATCALFHDEVERARELALDAHRYARGVSGRTAPKLKGPGLPWVALLLITGSPEQAKLGRELLFAPGSQRNASYPESLTVLRDLVEALEGRPLDTLIQPEADLDTLLAVLFVQLARNWGLGVPGEDLYAPLAESLCPLAARKFPTLVDEITLLSKGKDSPLSQQLRVQTEGWEMLLAELEGLVGESTDSQPSPSQDERLLWQVLVDEPLVRNVEAVLQKRTKKAWTKGRKVGAEALLSLETKACATAHDLRIASHWTKQVERGWGYPLTSYEWLPGVAGALVGHPRVFDARTQRQLQVIEGRPRLRVSEGERGVELEVEPPCVSEEGVWCESEGDELRIYTISAKLARVARLVDHVQSIPHSETQRAKKLLAGLAGDFEIQGDDVSFASGEVMERAASTSLVLRLWRLQSGGLRFQLVVQPFGDQGPTFSPGDGPAVLVHELDGVRTQVRRELERESGALQLLLEHSPLLAAQWEAGAKPRLEALDECLELISEVVHAPTEVELRWLEGQPLNLVARRDVGDVRWTFRDSDEWLEAQGEIELAPGQKVALRELLGLTEKEGRFVTLADGDVVELTERLLDRLQRVSKLGTVKKTGLVLHPLAAPSVQALLATGAQESEDSALSRWVQRFEEAQAIRPRVPRTLQAELRDYQLEGFRWLSRLGAAGAGALLCDDMGLGKTMQIMAVLLSRAKDGPSLVVAPTSVASHWEEELARFAPSLNVHRLRDAEDRASLVAGLTKRDLLLTSYGILQREGELLSSRAFEVAVLDEAQAIKNASTQRARAAFAIRATTRIVSTGTPVENGLHELWSLMHFANPGFLGGQKVFAERFVRPIVERGDRMASETLKQLTRPFILRRTKSQVLSELPEKTEIVLEIEPTEEEALLYETLRSDAAERLQAQREAAQRGQKKQTGAAATARFQVLAALTKLRQAACHPSLAGARGELPSAKHEAFFELVEELGQGGHRALVFSQFVEHLRLLQKGLDARKISYQYLDGSTSERERKERVARFQDGEGELFLISLRAGGSGLHLTGADYVIHMDPWWNPAVEDQASDRAHRMGQTRPVTIYKLVTKNTVEERIMALHGQKRESAEELLDGTEVAGTLDLEFLESLLS